MAKLGNMVIFVVAVGFSAIVNSAEAENYTVGGTTGWISSPTGGASFYSNWASNYTFSVNDTLVFDFTTGRHDVAILTKANFDNCNVSDPLQVVTTGPASVSLNRTGEFYFACAFTGHCNSGQKLSVNVTSSSSSAPSPSGSTGTDTNTTPPPPPPQDSSATSLADATFSLLLTSVALYLLFHT